MSKVNLVERLAKGMYEEGWRGTIDWDNEGEWIREMYRDLAKACRPIFETFLENFPFPLTLIEYNGKPTPIREALKAALKE